MQIQDLVNSVTQFADGQTIISFHKLLVDSQGSKITILPNANGDDGSRAREICEASLRSAEWKSEGMERARTLLQHFLDKSDEKQ
ncbi:MAG: hypothetical protein A3D96_06050 [Chlamydiae bacterium RIFCSPHIGHO2_12_FULL_44_59]|nr:MAG: hypothetical protein A2796_03875 [Chlamydiae bacterium RIFCSPHIGHO2_01_FULL_44_39]OGN58996.1 MAG: hypothetical protein A3C42_04180 [Chlamydiae bacterium RIFCSPHIGHO2_02_FULL_45_9]OGN61186.1 MAG: hypothetical protein A3D96_06050 [Chlamydiae bacterium RIFCSPHIGHO2_12_FULL_44_59]OGN65656.1 MAG: hypothetical protein A2978_06855 [Chlamydiae bacterium RIFCSPLOWO2_01_FULL_44_52]OGN68133.1 MAG: hypothetical protein A3I67_05525 [Chlamydiae bacterium RIFCSPLOWO2_02_FULL_45_22]OGN69022.1 MAG: hyp